MMIGWPTQLAEIKTVRVRGRNAFQTKPSCGARAWESHDWFEREAHYWAEGFLMAVPLVEPRIVALGGGMRLSRIADLCKVMVPFARRRLRRADLERLLWDDTVPGVLRAS
jgi:hypothetical protein